MNLYSIPAGAPGAVLAAEHVLATVPANALPSAVLLLPSRRAATAMREAFSQVLDGKTTLLPRIFSLTEVADELLGLLGPRAFGVMEQIPPAMPLWQQRYLLTLQARSFWAQRYGAASLDFGLILAEELMQLQDQCARAGVTLTPELLRPQFHADYAEHWKDSIAFLGILAEHWPAIEDGLGMTIAAAREVQILSALASAWAEQPPAFPVFAIGSTASQEATARLLATIASMPGGQVLLPGLPEAMQEEYWRAIAAGHPLYHVKQFLERLEVGLEDVTALGESMPNLWCTALAATDQIPHWKTQPVPDYSHLLIIPTAHGEEEARVLSLLLRETLETLGKRVALVTPDTGLLARVAAHMQRDGITVDRMQAGTLAQTETGSLWWLLSCAMAEPQRVLPLRSLLHHARMQVDGALLAAMEPYWYGVSRHRPGQLPRLPEAVRLHPALPPVQALAQQIARLGRGRMVASAWVEALTALLSPFVSTDTEDAVAEALEAIAQADMLGEMTVREFQALLAEALSAPWRDAGLAAHPHIALLTPVEARLQQFDRVILANMQEGIWPPLAAPSPWLNAAAQAALGLPSPQEHVSLLAHDVMMLASAPEVFLTYPKRDGGSPVARSRFIERLVTLLAAHGVAEEEITAGHYVAWAHARDAASHFAPAEQVRPCPPSHQRPTRLPVTALDSLFTDPFKLYARYVLQLKRVDDLDAELSASDFGSLAHRAIQVLSEHWNLTARAADEAEIAAMAAEALREFSDRPNVAIFWHARLLRALGWVNAEEGRRRIEPLTVQSETVMEEQLGSTGITLHGRIDRLEVSAQGAAIVDYKTGSTPTQKALAEGRGVQLLAYAMLVAQSGTAPDSLEYWALPKGREEGKILATHFAELEEKDCPARLSAALVAFLSAETPLLARPLMGQGGMFDDYDGISRYDEWAG